MRKLSNVILLAMVMGAFFSCSNDGPTIYKSIKGLWHCAEYPSMGVSKSYIVDIERSRNDTTQYQLFNFYNVDANESVSSHLKGANLTISKQPIGSTLNVVESGSGTVSLNFTRIDLTYHIYDGLNDIKVTAVYTR
ncbi:MAG: hypothetical protein Q8904_09820 [Bacteroidota bacterium]|nr:hypothetical protein [Bacteroidota bacterium]